MNGPAKMNIATLDDGTIEFGVGICAWTVLGDEEYLTPMLKGIYEKDSSFCAGISQFLNMNASELIAHYDDLQAALREMEEMDKEYLLQLGHPVKFILTSSMVARFAHMDVSDFDGHDYQKMKFYKNESVKKSL